MRIRTAQFVMIPMWVMTHPEVRGNATRIATYAGLRAVAWEAPDTDWRSLREIARAVSDVNGLGEEAVRKHLAELQRIGALVRSDEELIIPDDEPKLGMGVGTTVPNTGYVGTQTDHPHLLLLEREEERAPVGTTGASKADLNQEHPDFAAFWRAYPRKKDRPAAVRAFNRAVRANVDLRTILDGLAVEVTGWRRSKRPPSKIPYPATWLNSQGWANEPDLPDAAAAATGQRRRSDAEAAQRDEVAEAISAGRHGEAWRMIVEKAGSIPSTSWWPDAERLVDRSDTVIAMTVDADLDEVRAWRAMRQSALAGVWSGVSLAVGELPT